LNAATSGPVSRKIMPTLAASTRPPLACGHNEEPHVSAAETNAGREAWSEINALDDAAGGVEDAHLIGSRADDMDLSLDVECDPIWMAIRDCGAAGAFEPALRGQRSRSGGSRVTGSRIVPAGSRVMPGRTPSRRLRQRRGRPA
jgi:hypothetical protein